MIKKTLFWFLTIFIGFFKVTVFETSIIKHEYLIRDCEGNGWLFSWPISEIQNRRQLQDSARGLHHDFPNRYFCRYVQHHDYKYIGIVDNPEFKHEKPLGDSFALHCLDRHQK